MTAIRPSRERLRHRRARLTHRCPAEFVGRDYRRQAQRVTPEATGADAIAEATRDVADTLGLKVICAWTSSGATRLRIVRERPRRLR